MTMGLFDPCGACGGTGWQTGAYGRRQCDVCGGSGSGGLPGHSAEPVGRQTRETSAHAALDNAKRTTPQQHEVLKTHGAHPQGLTDYEVSLKTGMLRGTVAKRRGELAAPGAGFLEDSGIRRTTDSSSSTAIVWRLTEKGRTYLAGSA